MKKIEYKFRAECLLDVIGLLERFNGENYAITSEYTICSIGSSDVVVQLTAGLKLRKLIKIMEEVEDGHIMVRTVAEKEKYTGEYLRNEKH